MSRDSEENLSKPGIHESAYDTLEYRVLTENRLIAVEDTGETEQTGGQWSKINREKRRENVYRPTMQ